jgi:nitrate reductase beta subunit
MKIRAQIGMVLNLDKCIGCHTCSVTCKNVWTSREGMEYAWFNNVETKPGIGYPKEWENQDKWNGGWVRKANGKIEPRQGAKWALMSHFCQSQICRKSTTTTNRSLSITPFAHRTRIQSSTNGTPSLSLITGKRMEKIVWGPNWEEILGGEFAKAQQRQKL